MKNPYDHDQSKADVDALSEEIQTVVAFWRAKQPQLEKLISRRSAKQVALALVCRRQLAFLEGARILASEGRPEPVIACLRALYEGWLTALAISHLPNPPGKRGYWGRRYLAFGKFQRWHSNLHIRAYLVRSQGELGVSEREVDRHIAGLHRAWVSHSGEFSFTKPDEPWHNKGGTGGLCKVLWPNNGPPVFPKSRFPGTWDDWDSYFYRNFKFTSEFAHGQPAASTGYSGIGDINHLLDLPPIYQAGFLKGCRDFTMGTLEMFSEAIGFNAGMAEVIS